MALPSDVQLVAVTCGSGSTFFGEDATVTVEVAPVLGGNLKHLVHKTTGSFMTKSKQVFTGEPGQPATFTVPNSSQPEMWIDGTGAFFNSWGYLATIIVRAPNGETERWTKSFTPALGQTTIDLDLVPDGQIGGGVSAPVPPVTSVNGQTGAVVVEGGAEVTPEAVAANLPERLSETALSAAIDGKLEGLDFGAGAATYLDSYAWMGETSAFVDTQRTTTTTTTASVSAGASVLPLASVTGILAGVMLIVHGGTSAQQLVRVASVGGSDVTIVGTLGTALASGATVAPLWTNSSHLTAPGYDAMAYWVANHADMPDLTGKKVTLLGNSWFAGNSAWATRIVERFPTATVVNVGVAGNTSTAMLARFDTAVPADSDFVIIDEPGVNDTLTLDYTTSLANLAELNYRIAALGARAVSTGPVPLSTHPSKSKSLAQRVPAALRNDAVTALSPASNSTSTATGAGAQQEVPTGGSNTAYGTNAQRALTTGTFNTAIGTDAQKALTTGSQNNSIGAWAHRVLTTGVSNIAIGTQSGLALTTGSYNSHIGHTAGAKTTTGSNQVFIGNSSDMPDTVQYNGLTGIGSASKAGGGANATAIGYKVTALAAGAVAIGCDALGNGATATTMDEFVLGTARHRYKMPGLPTVAPAAASGILWNDAGVVKVA